MQNRHQIDISDLPVNASQESQGQEGQNKQMNARNFAVCQTAKDNQQAEYWQINDRNKF
jgi:hypothetical protein